MRDIHQIIESLTISLEKLAEKHKNALVELNEARSYNNNLKQQLSEQNEKIVELKAKLQANSVLDRTPDENGHEELKQLVMETVAEVDKCLALLNEN